MSSTDIGAVVDRRYVVRREISRGGMCVVYAAQHRLTGREIALKVLMDESRDDNRARRRLLREARATELARSEYVVDLLDAGEQDDGAPYLVLEMLRGRSLHGVLTARHRLGLESAVVIGSHIARALTHAHAHGVVHRDVKPDNIMFTRSAEGEVIAKLIDFGIAAVIPQRPGPAAVPEPTDKITRVGEVLGTPEYVAPECLYQTGIVDRRSDIYSLGVTLYECLAGSVPFTGDFGEVLVKAHTTQPADLTASRADVPPELAGLLRRALALNPEDRFPSAAEMERALSAFLPPGTGHLIDGSLPKSGPPEPPSARGTTVRMRPVQRRRFQRAAFVTPVRISHHDGKITYGKTEDISEGGMLVISEAPCANGTVARARFVSPLSGRVVEVAAMIRWVKPARGRAAIGFEFVDLPEECRAEIEEYVGLMTGEL